MKKICLTILLVLATACAPVVNAKPAIPPTPTITPFVVPVLPKATLMPTATPIVVSPTPFPEKPLFYTVALGDTLGEIAEKFGLTIEYLAKINHLKNPDWILADQQILLVSREEVLERAFAEKGKKIIVILATQKVYALEGSTAVNEFTVSTGVPAHPTVIGKYAIYVKYLAIEMDGPGYALPNVPFTMYFYKGYGLHGTYWHHNFGTPMSHGCVNMRTKPDAEWLFGWAEIGTPVWVIP